MNTSSLELLTSFRQHMYQLFTRRRDALFDLTDALLTTGPMLSPAHLSLASSFQRGWGSIYDALLDGHIDDKAIETLLAQYPKDRWGVSLRRRRKSYGRVAMPKRAPNVPFTTTPLVTQQDNRSSQAGPIDFLAQVGLARSSWTAPVKVQRLKPDNNVNLVAVEQIKALLQERPASEPLPIFVFDALSEPVRLAQAWGTLYAAALIRLRAGRCFYADPTDQAATGRPPRHGHKFACAVPTTWLEPDQDYTTEDRKSGQVHVRAWHNLHTIPQKHAKRGTRGPRPLIRGTLILVEVSRLPKRTRDPKPLWLWWHAPELPVLSRVWRAYVSRFDLEHTFRFVKHILNWTVPRVRHPQQADRWTWLVILAYTELRLARPVVADQRLPMAKGPWLKAS